jgi:predicted nucleic acid-binding protein
MAFVLDASITASWAFQDEGHPCGEAALNRIRTEEAMVPAVWWFEVRNILVVNERRGRIREPNTLSFLAHLSRLRVRIDRSPDETSILHLARLHGLTVYDASYLELARREQVALATLDTALVRAAAAEQVALVGA